MGVREKRQSIILLSNFIIYAPAMFLFLCFGSPRFNSLTDGTWVGSENY